MRVEIKLSRKIQLAIMLGLMVLIVIGVESYRTAVLFVESSEIVARSHQVIAVLEATLEDIVSVESETRGYVISGNEKYMKLYNTALEEVERDLKELRRLVTDMQVRGMLVDLERLTRQRLERLRITIQTRRLEGFEAIPKTTSVGKQMMDDLRGVVAEMIAREHELLTERDNYAKKLARRTTFVVAFGSVFAVLLAVGSLAVVTSDLRHRERLEREVLEISERERNRIGQDLHDGVCQHLTGISLFSRSLQQKLAVKAPSEAKEAARITELINDSIEQTRRVTRGLHPVPDEPTGLMLALRELSDLTGATGDPVCQFDCPAPVPVTNQAMATHLYRIAQEAVQNAVRHAGAKKIVVGLRLDEHHLRLTVSDDGKGLPTAAGGRGMGMEIMRYRAGSIGGTLEASAAPSRGTIITCTLERTSLA
jgi:signal transduction histidine kinase